MRPRRGPLCFTQAAPARASGAFCCSVKDNVITGSGIDVIEIGRIQRAVDRYGGRFLDRVYLAAEKAYCLRKRNSAESFAARFAAKEAAAKALGTGISFGVNWLEIEVVREPSGRPSLRFLRTRRRNCQAPGGGAFQSFTYPHGRPRRRQRSAGRRAVGPPILLSSRRELLPLIRLLFVRGM